MEIATLKIVNAERRARRAVVVVTDLATGHARVVREGDDLTGELGEAVAAAFRSGRSGVAEVGGNTFFLNAHLPHARLVIVGAVHISQALAPMARIAGFPVEIIDPRTAFACQERFPGVTLYPDWPQDVVKYRPFDPYTALAVVTHDPKIDDFPLKAGLDAGCFYVGALGSRKTHAKRVSRLLAMGATHQQVERIRAPIGVDIKAASPAEIAVAVLAEVIGALRTRGLEGERQHKGDPA